MKRRMYDPRSPHLLSFTESRKEFEAGTSSPRVFLERCLEMIERREPQVLSFVILNPEQARRAADGASERYRCNRPLSPIDGCPVGIKDIINTADFPTQMNSEIYRDWKP